MKWLMLPLEQMAEIIGGSTPSRTKSEFWGGDIPWLTPTDLPMPGQGIAQVTETTDYITSLGLSSCSANLLPIGTILFSSRATIGKLGIAKVPLATNQGFTNFIPKSFLYNFYLAYALQYFTSEITLLAGSTTFKEVSKGSLKKFKIPLPTLSEQRCIVEILDQADTLRRMRAEADAKGDRILPALFIKMFGDPATNPMGWGENKLLDLDIDFRYGTSVKCDFIIHGLPVLLDNLYKLRRQREQSKSLLESIFQSLLSRAFSGELTAKWRETHIKELLAEMEEQAKALNLTDNADFQ